MSGSEAHLEAIQRQLQTHLKKQKEHPQLGELLKLLLIPEQPACTVPDGPMERYARVPQVCKWSNACVEVCTHHTAVETLTLAGRGLGLRKGIPGLGRPSQT